MIWGKIEEVFFRYLHFQLGVKGFAKSYRKQQKQQQQQNPKHLAFQRILSQVIHQIALEWFSLFPLMKMPMTLIPAKIALVSDLVGPWC